ncbi:hypothetical protein HYU95_04515 [Candidatus Daviesbacteria bacterium]|nr:hypothetical protein [Candidatus Daviesbacteria bacterium]
MFTYLIILAAVLLVSPFVLKIASSQKKESKKQLKFIFIFILSAQILLGFFNWENFSVGRSGFELTLDYLQSFLGLFFIVTAVQIVLVLLKQKCHTLAVLLNFINTIIIFAGMIRLGQITGIQLVSFASIGAVFAVLIGNVIGLVFINRDKNLLKKYPFKNG